MSIMEMEEIKNAIAGVDAKVEYNGGGIDELKANALLNAGSVVKSVQRGVVSQTMANSGAQKETAVEISEINPSKSIALVSARSSSNSVCPLSIVKALSATQLTISASTFQGDGFSGNGTNQHTYGWQVIEFY